MRPVSDRDYRPGNGGVGHVLNVPVQACQKRLTGTSQKKTKRLHLAPTMVRRQRGN